MVDHRKLEAEAHWRGMTLDRMCKAAGMLPAKYYRRRRDGGMTLAEAEAFGKALDLAPETFQEIFLKGVLETNEKGANVQ